MIFKYLKNIFDRVTNKITNHDTSSIKSFNDFVNYMHMPVDSASLSIGRMFFGTLIKLNPIPNVTFK